MIERAQATPTTLSGAIGNALPQRRAIAVLLTGITALGSILAHAPRADAATFTVTSSGDPGASGLSLRQAIAAANADSGSSFVLFDASLAGSTITLTQGQISITRPMAIVGPGAGKLTISGNNSSAIFVMETNMATPSVSLSGLTITAASSGIGNGAVFAKNTSLVVQDSAISGNAGQPAGIHAYSSGASYYAHVDNVVMTNNNASGGGEAVLFETLSGGKLSARLRYCTISNTIGRAVTVTQGADVSIEHSLLSSNSVLGPGGAVNGFNAQSIVISDSTVTGNTSSGNGGGAVYSYDTPVTIERSGIRGNSAGNHDGGGILIDGTTHASLQLSHSTVSGNSAYDFGAGIDVKHAAIVSIFYSTISDNTLADFSTSANGGGLALESVLGTTLVVDSTFYHNFAYNSGGGIGIFDATTGSNTTIGYSTFVKNGTFGAASNGILGSGEPKIRSSIIANNANNYAATQDLTGSFNITYSLVKNASAATLTGNHNIADGTDPQLGTLAENGGPTLTMLPIAGSPVIDAGIALPSFGLDQRGVTRHVGSATDMGAVERQVPEVIIFRNGFDPP